MDDLIAKSKRKSSYFIEFITKTYNFKIRVNLKEAF